MVKGRARNKPKKPKKMAKNISPKTTVAGIKEILFFRHIYFVGWLHRSFRTRVERTETTFNRVRLFLRLYCRAQPGHKAFDKGFPRWFCSIG